MSDWHKAEQHAERAHRFYRAGQWERALEELRTALQHRPDEGEWLFGLGLTLDALERYDEAADAYARALRVRGEDVPGLLHLGVDLIRSNQPRLAIEALERVNQLDPEAELGYAHRILAHTLLEEHEQAELMFYLARQHADGPDEDLETQAMAYDYLAQSLHMRHDVDRAIWCWQEALRLDPAHPEANRSLAATHQLRGQSERARQHYQRQLRVNPDDVDTLLDFADLLFECNRLAEAGDKYRRALECDGTLSVAHRRLGELAIINGHLAAATDRFERARQLDPDQPGVHLGLATAAHRRGDTADARRWVLEELRREGQSSEQVLDLAGLLVDLGLTSDAVRLLTPMVSGVMPMGIGHDAAPLAVDDALFATALLCRSVALAAEGRLDEALDDAQRCVHLQPDNPTALLQLATAHLALGDLEQARVRLTHGLSKKPYDPQLRRLRRQLLRARLAATIRRVFRRG